MPFPDTPRVIYAQNPLVEVICQLRFPSLLRIDTEPPAAFQEKIRAEYPRYSEVRPTLELPAKPPPELAKLLLTLAPHKGPIGHEFRSGDKAWLVSLTREFLALKTDSYGRWEDFRDRLDRLLRALVDEYKPSFFTRVGLRYVNVIQLSKLSLKNTPWSDLLNPHIAGEFSSPDIADRIEETTCATVVRFDDHGGRITVRHGLGTAEPDKEICFMIDADFFVEAETETADALTILDRFNHGAGNLFRWCIKPKLRGALEPSEIRD